MVRMIRRDGGEMWCHESRVEEYLAAGCRQAAPQPEGGEGERIATPACGLVRNDSPEGESKKKVPGTDTRKTRKKG